MSLDTSKYELKGIILVAVFFFHFRRIFFSLW